MKHFVPPLGAALLAACWSSAAAAGIVFGPVKAQPGESIRLVTHSETDGATVEKTSEGKTRKGTMSMVRNRDLMWTFRSPGADRTRRGMVKVNVLNSRTVVKLAGQQDDTGVDASPLTGKLFAMSKSPEGDWKFELDGSVPYTRIEHEIEELKVYLKRDWFPKQEVNLGDSWDFDPAWVKRVIEKDLANAQSIGTMRLRQVRHTEKGKFAVIDVTIRSSGADFAADGSEASATIELSGQVTVNLDTMLDESLELKGVVTTASRKGGEATTAKLPVRFSATKAFAREAGM